MGVISANKSVCVGHGIKLEEKIILLIFAKIFRKIQLDKLSRIGISEKLR